MPIYEFECSECSHVYEFLETRPSDVIRDCPLCGGKGVKLYSTYSPKFFQGFVTRNIDPSGRPIHVKSQKQLSSLCNEHNLVHLDDPGEKNTPQQKYRTPGQITGMIERPERPTAHGPIHKADLE
jgi:putative FmdB family regulatory protein